jgi:RHS repeat-associated protein
MRATGARLSALVIAGLVGILPVASQEHPNQARGIQPQNAFSTGGIDSVNGMNGGLSLSIPLGQSYPMNGGWSYSFGLSYASNFWKYNVRSQHRTCTAGTAVEANVDPSFNAGAGWTFGMGRLISPLDTASNESSRWIYIDPSGGRHTFHSTLHEQESTSGGCTSPLGCTFQYTRDNTYLRLNRNQRMVEFPDGNQHTFRADSYLSKIEDRSGNRVDIGTTPETIPTTVGAPLAMTVTDTLGRSHTANFVVVNYAGVKGLQLTGLSLAAFGGAQADYTFEYDNTTVWRTDKDTYCGNNSPPGSSGADLMNVSFLKRIVGPESLIWSMQKPNGQGYYFRPAGQRDIRAGVIESLELPTGGSLSWTWRTWEFPAGKNSFRDKAAGVAKKTVYDPHEPDTNGDWTYTSELCPKVGAEDTTDYCGVTGPRSNEVISVITSPDHTKFIRYFTANTYDGTANSSAGGEHANWDYGLPFSCREGEIAPSGSRKCISTAINGSGIDGGRQRSTWLRFTRDKKPTVSGDPGPGTLWNLNRRTNFSRLKFDDDGTGRYTEEDLTDFDGLGHYRVRSETGQFTTSNWRQFITKYNKVTGCYDINLSNESQTCTSQAQTFAMPATGSNWILDRFAFTSKNEEGIVEKRSYFYLAGDGPLDCYRILTGPPNSGWVNSANDVYVDLTYSAESHGNPASERWFGGDGASLSTAAGCSVTGTPSYEIAHDYGGGVLASSRHLGSGITHYDYQATIDTATGLPSAVFDPSGFKTTLSYDLLGRVTEVAPVGVGAGNTWDDGAKTSFTYSFGTTESPRTRVFWSRSCPAVATSCGETFPQGEQYFDGFGRAMQERLLRPNGTWVNRYSEFNISGWLLRNSEWTPDDETVHYTEYRDFDPLGRPRKIYSPDRPYVDSDTPHTKLTYYGIRQLDRDVWVATALDGTETQQKTTYIWDGFGRLKSVSEPSGALNGQVVTTYGYDVGDRLRSVTTPIDAATSQRRLFKYDHRGFLKFEKLPEKAAPFADPDPLIEETYSVAYNYDARGNVTSIQDGSAADWQKLTYDKAERLLEVKDGAAGNRLLKRFTYDTGSTGLALSKLTKSERWNYFDHLSMKAVVTQSLHYGGVEGRISSRTTAMAVNALSPWEVVGVPSESFAQTFSWNRAGELVGQSYPVCSGGSCPAGGQTPRSATNSFTHGFLTGTSYNGASVATLSYHPSGILNQALHDNSTVASQKTKMIIGADPAGMARPGSLGYFTGTTSLPQFGTFSYDGVGNIKAQSGAASRFKYDGVSRLTEAELGFGGGPYRQKYSYDRFGNINEIKTQVGAAGETTVPTQTNPATNRLSVGSTSYDDAGNMKSYLIGAQEYFYDALGQTFRTVKGGADWIYVYSADGERLWSYRVAGSGSYFTLRGLGGEVLRETALHLGGNSFTDFVYGAGLLAKFDASGARTDYHVDHLGTPRLAVNAAGAVQRYYMYYPYGQEFNAPATADTFRIRFTGHERDLLNTASAADDNEYHHARNFSLTTARYHSPDPVRGDAFAPQRWNLFSYVGGNPMNRIDPFGLDWCTVVQSDANGKQETRTFWCENMNIVDKGPLRPASGGGGGGVDGGRHGPWSLLDRLLALVDRVRRFRENCGGGSVGISVSGVAPVRIENGQPVLGVVGLNLQFLPGAIGLFEFGTKEGEPPAYPSAAFGVSATANFAFGSGSWAGRSRTIAGNGGPIAVEGFMSPSGPSWNSWQGIGGGGSEGLPVGGVLSTNHFVPLFVFGPNAGPCSQ